MKRSLWILTALSGLAALPAAAQEEHAANGPLTVEFGLMFWTVVVFLLLMLVLKRYAWPSLLGAVEAREKALEEMLAEAERNRAEAAKLLAERKIGALVVTGPDQRVVGIVSERDIVQELAAHGPAALDLALTEVMTRKVTTCSASDTISSVMERMTAGKFRHLPVLEQGRLAGIVSIGDVVKHRLQEMEREQSALRDYIQTA